MMSCNFLSKIRIHELMQIQKERDRRINDEISMEERKVYPIIEYLLINLEGMIEFLKLPFYSHHTND